MAAALVAAACVWQSYQIGTQVAPQSATIVGMQTLKNGYAARHYYLARLIDAGELVAVRVHNDGLHTAIVHRRNGSGEAYERGGGFNGQSGEILTCDTRTYDLRWTEFTAELNVADRCVPVGRTSTGDVAYVARTAAECADREQQRGFGPGMAVPADGFLMVGFCGVKYSNKFDLFCLAPPLSNDHTGDKKNDIYSGDNTKDNKDSEDKMNNDQQSSDEKDGRGRKH